MFHTFDKSVPSTDKVHMLKGVVYVPEGEIKAIVQVVHGMEEHIGRYDPFLRFLAQRGFLAFGYDHLGHGRTAIKSEELGFFARKNGDQILVDDVHAFFSQIKAQYPGHTFILFGHSMGSFIARLVAAQYGSELDGLILSGTGSANSAVGAGLAVSRLVRLLRGSHYVSDRLEGIAFTKYNDRFPEQDDYAWLTRNPEIRAAYAADPFCNFHFSVSALQDLARLNRRCNAPACFEATPAELPIFLISGAEDPVGDYGEGVKKVMRAYERRGIAHLSMKLYDGCRHELLNELNQEEVYADILSFLYSIV